MSGSAPDAIDLIASRVEVVLVGTSHPGNIGAAARAMKTMGLSRLKLVEPRQFPSPEAVAMASGADDLLLAADCCGTVAQAVSNATLVIGASARSRRADRQPVDGRSAAGIAIDELLGGGRVALLFGRERTGLTNEELDYCHHLLQLPANPEYASLNVASAVQICAYEMRIAALAAAGLDGQPTARAAHARHPAHLAADTATMEGFYHQLEQLATDSGFLKPEQPGQLMRRLRLLFARARPTNSELNIVRGLLAACRSRE
jgi:tRNA (cytidine32/uridine32-2'-O)-methyltransferase